MKSKLLLLPFLFLFGITTVMSQSSAGQTGIAVQGIARDIDNTVRANTNISLTFTLYYKVGGTEYEIMSPDAVNLETDAFGVFSHVIDPNVENYSKFANHEVWLRIKEGSFVISDEILKHVPYAIAASNGVPTGSIMPFIGTTAPDGWVLCDGTDLTSKPGAEKLIALLGSNFTPNLGGMFLRGTGGSGNHVGPDLMATQDDSNKEHNHAAGGLITDNPGNHQHDLKYRLSGIENDGYARARSATGNNYTGGNSGDPMTNEGAHTHEISGNTANSGTESRPVNYGVNYIIKL